MTTRVYKYHIPVTDRVELLLPIGSHILTAQVIKDKLWVYAAVEPDSARYKMETKVIRVYGTGHDMEDNLMLNYIGTVQQYDGDLVWHIFEELERND